MNETMEEQYKALGTYLIEKVDYNRVNVDKQTLESIIAASCDFDFNDNARTSYVIPDIVHPRQSISVKFSNVHFSLKTALDMILLIPDQKLSNELEIIRFIIGVMKFSLDNFEIEIGTDETKILRQIYLLDYNRKGVLETILKENMEGIDDEKFDKAINNLKITHCIEDVFMDIDGKTEKAYILIEKVLLNIR